MDRKIVKPAQEGGKIWNPEHGRFLPAGGLEVEMTPYWLGLAGREDISVSDVPAEPEAEAETEVVTEVEAPAPVPAMPVAKVAPTA